MIQATELNPHYYYPQQCERQGEKFFSRYQVLLEIGCPDEKMKGLKEINLRSCRFCGKKKPYVSFRKVAHVIPEMLGNRFLIYDQECDECNGIFGRYENDLANYLGIRRTVQKVHGKKIPVYKSKFDEIVARFEKKSDDGDYLSIKRSEADNDNFEFDKANNWLCIKYTKNSYIPLNVFKALMRIALAIMPENELKNYSFALDFLRTSEHDNKFKGFGIVHTYTLPLLTFSFEKPSSILFRKKNPEDALFTHLFVICFMNYEFQLFVPFHDSDVRHFIRGAIETPWMPPILGRKDSTGIGEIIVDSIDFNSMDKRTDDVDKLIIPNLFKDYESVPFTNKETGEIYERNFEPEKVIGLNLKFFEVRDDENI